MNMTVFSYQVFIYFWLSCVSDACWAFLLARLGCRGFSLGGLPLSPSRLLVPAQELRFAGSGEQAGSVVAAHGLSCSAAVGSSRDQTVSPALTDGFLPSEPPQRLLHPSYL